MDSFLKVLDHAAWRRSAVVALALACAGCVSDGPLGDLVMTAGQVSTDIGLAFDKATQSAEAQLLGQEDSSIPATSANATLLISLRSNIQKTNFYVDGALVATGKHAKVYVDNRQQHTITAEPECYIEKETLIQPPYQNNTIVGFYYLKEDRLAQCGKPTIAGAGGVDPELTMAVQEALLAAGYPLGLADGALGPQTQSAIRQAEHDAGHMPSGVPSAALLDWLKQQKNLVHDIQQALIARGFLDDQRPTGVMGERTKIAIENAELQLGLPADGKPDRDLLRTLQAAARPPVSKSDQDAAAASLFFRIESALVELGYLKGPAAGVETIDAREAIRTAELDLGLPADGEPDLQLWRVLEAKLHGI
jgi:peptidoglycan hydrolase-like protein with peptidoglycan-binding domain